MIVIQSLAEIIQYTLAESHGILMYDSFLHALMHIFFTQVGIISNGVSIWEL